MYVFKLGQPYPLHDEADGQEKARADLTPTFFSVVYYILNARPADVQQFAGRFEYGIYEAAPGVPFILTWFAATGWLFDVTLNWHLMGDPAEQALWPTHEEPAALTFALVDAKTNKLLAYRRAPAAPRFAAQVRECAGRQLALFPDRYTVEQAISRAELMPLQLMQRQATMFSIQ